MTTRGRVLAAVAAVAAVVALGAAPAPAAAPAPLPTGFVLRGGATASVEVTVPTAWRLPRFGIGGRPHRATFKGTYAGFMVEQAPLTPARQARPVPVLGMLFVRGWYVTSKAYEGPLPLRWGSAVDGATLEPGRYRFTLFADAPAEVLVSAEGAGRVERRPADKVAATVRVLPRLTPLAGDSAKRRVGVLRSIPAQPDTVAAWGTFSHLAGRKHEMAMCLVRSDQRDRDKLTCQVPSEDAALPGLESRDECLWWVRFEYEEHQRDTFAFIGFSRAGDYGAGGQRVSSPHPDVSLQPAAPVGHCSVPKARYDVLVHEALSRPLTRPASGAAAVFVDPAPLRSVVEDPAS